MSWYSPNMTASSSRHRADAPSSLDHNREQERQQLRSTTTDAAAAAAAAAVPNAPTTPSNVRNLTPNTCLAIVEFKDLLRQHRQVDDLITTRLNRHLARSREQGQLSSPSLLSSTSQTASTATDLGQSTYSKVPLQTCAQFWSELLEVWKGREDVVRYCIGVAERSSGPVNATEDALAPASRRIEDGDRRLDADFRLPSTTTTSATTAAAVDASAQTRWGRGENQNEFLTRQMRNELAIESIIRKRSLEAFKSRCRLFEPNPPPGPEGDRERAMWLGRDTPAAAAAAAGASRI